METQKQATHNLQTDGQADDYLLLTTIYAPELVTLNYSITLVLRGLNTALHRWKQHMKGTSPIIN